MSLEEKKYRAEDARQLLDNKMLQDAFDAVAGYIETQAMTCSPDDKEKCTRIVISKQLLSGIKREIYRHIEDGQIADVQLAELERKKAFSLFRR